MALYIWSNQIILCGLFVCFCAVQSGTCKKGLCTVQIKQCSWSTGKVLIWRETKKNLKVRQMFLLLKRNDEKWRCRYFLLHKQSRTNTSCTLRSCTFPVQWKATIATDYTSCSTDKEVELKEWWKQYKHDICTLLYGLEIYRGSDLSTGNLSWSWTLQGASWGAEKGAFPTFQTSYICQVVYRCVRWTCALCINGYPLLPKQPW